MEVFKIEILLLLLVVGTLNYVVWKVFARNNRNGILLGIVVLLLSPVLFLLTFFILGMPISYASGTIAIFYTLLVANGLMLILIGIFTDRKESKTHF